MQRIGRSSALMPVYIALACWILVQAPTAAAQAGPFAKNLDIADPAMTLSSAQREAARALGEASRLVESGETVEARRALDRVSGVPQLAGYAELVWAIIREESHYRVDARSVVGALGLLQLMPKTAAQLATKQGLDSFESEDLFDPRTNITLGSAYLAQLGTRFDGRMSAAIGSYNAGPTRFRPGFGERPGGSKTTSGSKTFPTIRHAVMSNECCEVCMSTRFSTAPSKTVAQPSCPAIDSVTWRTASYLPTCQTGHGDSTWLTDPSLESKSWK
jgi:soluble lytic murein transglycosylase-like protein